MDKYEAYVGNTVKAIRSGNEHEIAKTAADLDTLQIIEVLSELCIWIYDITVEKNLDELFALATLPLPHDSKLVVKAIENDDVKALHTYADGDLAVLLAALFAITASLQEASERL